MGSMWTNGLWSNGHKPMVQPDLVDLVWVAPSHSHGAIPSALSPLVPRFFSRAWTPPPRCAGRLRLLPTPAAPPPLGESPPQTPLLKPQSSSAENPNPSHGSVGFSGVTPAPGLRLCISAASSSTLCASSSDPLLSSGPAPLSLCGCDTPDLLVKSLHDHAPVLPPPTTTPAGGLLGGCNPGVANLANSGFGGDLECCGQVWWCCGVWLLPVWLGAGDAPLLGFSLCRRRCVDAAAVVFLLLRHMRGGSTSSATPALTLLLPCLGYSFTRWPSPQVQVDKLSFCSLMSKLRLLLCCGTELLMLPCPDSFQLVA